MTEDRDTGSIGTLLDEGYGIHIYCDAKGCHANAEMDLVGLAEKYGRDKNVKRQIIPMMYCPKCGSKKLSTRLIAPGTRDSASMVKPG